LISNDDIQVLLHADPEGILLSYSRNLTPALAGVDEVQALASVSLSRRSISLPSPANNVGINLMVGPNAAPYAVNPTTGKRKHVGAIVVLTKQFHQFPGWGVTD
jgi:hypothetical protein